MYVCMYKYTKSEILFGPPHFSNQGYAIDRFDFAVDFVALFSVHFDHVNSHTCKILSDCDKLFYE